MELERIEKLIEAINKIIESIYKEDEKAYYMYSCIFGELSKMYEEYISYIPALNEIGLEIDINSVMDELRTINSAIKKRDDIKLYDTLKYRMLVTIQDYIEIKKIMLE